MREHERIDRPGGLKLTGIYEKMEVNCIKLRTGISRRLRVKKVEYKRAVQTPSLPNTKTRQLRPKTQRSWGRKFGAKGLWDQGTGKAGEERSRMDLGSSWVSHIHTLRVETGH